VLYIPVCPLTERNAAYLGRQRAAFLAGGPGPDFGDGVGEAAHVGRPGLGDVRGREGRRAMGLEGLEGEGEVVKRGNAILGL
jgi:hypothetical protein